jgi:hypothetical protein
VRVGGGGTEEEGGAAHLFRSFSPERPAPGKGVAFVQAHVALAKRQRGNDGGAAAAKRESVAGQADR